MNSIVLEDVGKRYRQTSGPELLVKRLLTMHRDRGKYLWALSDISFSCEAGETLGIIGRNGSGKTTLLKLLSGVSAPTTGRLQVTGAIAPLIGVGVGFNPELTGRENVFVNGRLLGMTQSEVVNSFDSIVDFSEIEDFIDTPVKFYSTGMFLRLAFAVAIHARPEVLIVDEVLAVGDLAFQLKCNDRMREIQRGGTTVVIVTHNLQMLDRMAPRTILLNKGKLVFDGATEAAIGAYHDILQADTPDWDNRAVGLIDEGQMPRYAGGAVVAVDAEDVKGNAARHFDTGDEIVVKATVTFTREVAAPRLGVMVAPLGQGACYTSFTYPGLYPTVHGPDKPLTAEVRLQNHLLGGSYSIQVGLYDESATVMLGISQAEVIYVTASRSGGGIVDMQSEFFVAGKHLERFHIGRLSEEPSPPKRRRKASERPRTGNR